jgi:hypothetical protein
MVNNLNRRIILKEYSALKERDQRSTVHLVRELMTIMQHKYGIHYTKDVNHSNSYILRVIRES